MRRHAALWVPVLLCVLVAAGLRGSPDGGLPTAGPRDLEPLVLAFYYTWYGTPWGTSGRWVHWDEGGHHPGERDARGWRDLGAAQHPEGGPYDSLDSQTVRGHASLSQAAGIDGWISTWWAVNDRHDRAFALVLRTLQEIDSPVRATVYYETTRGSAGRAIGDLKYILARYANHGSFLRFRGKPVIFVYGRAMNELSIEAWQSVVAAVRRDHPCVLVADTGNRELIRLFGGGHHYNPVGTVLGGDNMVAYYRNVVSGCRAAGGIAAVTVLPGYDDRQIRNPGLFLDRRGGQTYDELWHAARSARPDWVLVTSFNEWHEGSEIEPSKEHGRYYLETTRLQSTLLRGGGRGLVVDPLVTSPKRPNPPRIEIDGNADVVFAPHSVRVAWLVANLSPDAAKLRISGPEMGVVRVARADRSRDKPLPPRLVALLERPDPPLEIVVGPGESVHIWPARYLQGTLDRGPYDASEEVRGPLVSGMCITLRSPGLEPDGDGRRLTTPPGVRLPLEISLRALEVGATLDASQTTDARFRISGAEGFRLAGGALVVPDDASPGRHLLSLEADVGEHRLSSRLLVHVVSPFSADIAAVKGEMVLLLRPVAPSLQTGEVEVMLRTRDGEPIHETRIDLEARPPGGRERIRLVLPRRLWTPQSSPGEFEARVRWKGHEIVRTVRLEGSLDLGAGPEGDGLRHVGYRGDGDGNTRPDHSGGKPCRRGLIFGKAPGYFYFDIDDSFLTDGGVAITVEYLDDVDGVLGLHYDSADSTLPQGGAYRRAEPVVALQGSGTWKRATWTLRDARLAGRQNFSADFRIYSTHPLRVSGVRARALVGATGTAGSTESR